MVARPLSIDADSHVLEPRNTWIDYIDPAFRERAIRIAVDERGDEVLLVDGRPVESMRNGLAGLGGINLDPAEALDRDERAALRGRLPARRLRPGRPAAGHGRRGHRHLAALPDDRDLLGGPRHRPGPGHRVQPCLQPLHRRLLLATTPHRLVPVAHISLIDEDGAVEEVVRAREAGCRAVYLSPDLAARAGRGSAIPPSTGSGPRWRISTCRSASTWWCATDPAFPPPSIDRIGGRSLFAFAFLAIDVMAAFTEMLASGVFEKHPRLRCTVLESGATWIAAWLDRMDHKFEVMRSITPTSMKPSEYFFRQCLVSADPDETVIAPIIEAVGSDYFVWASDYPHIDASFGVVGEIRSRLGAPQ